VESKPVVRADVETEESERKTSGSSNKSVDVSTAAIIRKETR